jgi:DNA polymerase
LQRDLGGDEVIFDAPVTPALDPEPAASAAPRRGSRRASPEAAPEVPAAPPERVWRRPSYPEGQEPAWLVGAPPIPGPGLHVELPPLPARAAAWTSLEEIAAQVAGCQACPLAAGRTHTVPGEGNPTARLMVVGEGPGEQEDRRGRPFVGRAGQLLDKMLEAIDLPRAEVYIANVVKCRPPQNRAPLPDERAACLPYLQRQIELVAPRVILALGTTAAEALLGGRRTLGALRLKVHTLGETPLVVTYHPAALLRNPNWKRPAWDDVRIARQLVVADS